MWKVTGKYQITIPINARKALDIIPGSKVDIVSKGSNYVLKECQYGSNDKNYV